MSPRQRLWSLLGVLLLCGADARAQESVSVRRLNDSVSVRMGPERSERVLYFFDPEIELFQGDELEQGSVAQSTVVLSSGGLVQFFSSGHLVLEQLSEQGDVLRFPILVHAELTSGLRPLVIWLPGGHKLSFLGTTVVVRVQPGRMVVRNEGGPPVDVEGIISLDVGGAGGDGRSSVILNRGEEVHLPLFPITPGPLGVTLSSWQGRSVRYSGGFELERDGGDLLVQRTTEEEGDVLTVGGARVFGARGLTLRLSGAPRAPGSGTPPTVAPTEQEIVPPGMIAIDAAQYYQYREAGHTDEELAANGVWVSSSIRDEYEQRASRQNGARAEETEPDTEES